MSKFEVDDEVKLSAKGEKYFSRDNWTKYKVPYSMFCGDYAVVTQIIEECEGGVDQIYVQNATGCVYYYEDDIELVSEQQPNEKLQEILNLDAPKQQSALDVQVGGEHYKNKGIQPVEYAFRNNLGFLEANVVKYVSRHEDKNGADDIKKAIHYCKFILEFKYGIKE